MTLSMLPDAMATYLSGWMSGEPGRMNRPDQSLSPWAQPCGPSRVDPAVWTQTCGSSRGDSGNLKTILKYLIMVLMCNYCRGIIRPSIIRTALYRSMAAAITLALLAACGTAFPAVDGKTRVIASAYPFAWIAQEIGGAQIELRNLTPAGSEPHDVELTPHQVAAVQDTDVMVYERGFQPSVDNAVDQAGRS